MIDEECIAIAMLHGAYFWHHRGIDPASLSKLRLYFAIDPGGDENSQTVPHSRGSSPGDAARNYCVRHKLLPEVTDAPQAALHSDLQA
jgi:hypothetical protein